MKESITVRIEPDIWKEVRKRSIEHGLTAGSFVETAILRFLRSYREKDLEECKKV